MATLPYFFSFFLLHFFQFAATELPVCDEKAPKWVGVRPWMTNQRAEGCALVSATNMSDLCESDPTQSEKSGDWLWAAVTQRV